MPIVARAGAFLATAVAVAPFVADGAVILRVQDEQIAGNVRRGGSSPRRPQAFASSSLGTPPLLLPLPLEEEEEEALTLTLPPRQLGVVASTTSETIHAVGHPSSSSLSSRRRRIARIAEEEAPRVALPKVAPEHRIFTLPSSSFDAEVVLAARQLTTECPDYSQMTCTLDSTCTCSSSATASRVEVQAGDPPQPCYLCREPQPAPACPQSPSCTTEASCVCDEGIVKTTVLADMPDGTQAECYSCRVPRECPTFPTCSFESDCYCDPSNSLLTKAEATVNGQVCYGCRQDSPAGSDAAAATTSPPPPPECPLEPQCTPQASCVCSDPAFVHAEVLDTDDNACYVCRESDLAAAATESAAPQECPLHPQCIADEGCVCSDPAYNQTKVEDTAGDACYACKPINEECPSDGDACGFNPNCGCDNTPGKSFMEFASTDGTRCYACRSPPKCSEGGNNGTCSRYQGCWCDAGTSRREVETTTGDFCWACVGGNVECPSEIDACSWLSECGCDDSDGERVALTTDGGEECWACRNPECPDGDSCTSDASCVCREPSTKEEFALTAELGGGVCYGCREPPTPTGCPVGPTECTPDETCHCDAIASSIKRAIQSTSGGTCYQCHVPSVCPAADDCSPEPDCYCDSNDSPIEFVSTVGDLCWGCPSTEKVCPDEGCTKNYLCHCPKGKTKTEYMASGGGVCFACSGS